MKKLKKAKKSGQKELEDLKAQAEFERKTAAKNLLQMEASVGLKVNQLKMVGLYMLSAHLRQFDSEASRACLNRWLWAMVRGCQRPAVDAIAVAQQRYATLEKLRANLRVVADQDPALLASAKEEKRLA